MNVSDKQTIPHHWASVKSFFIFFKKKDTGYPGGKTNGAFK